MMQTNFYLVLLISVGLISSSQITLAQTYQNSGRIPLADRTMGTQVRDVSGNQNFEITGGQTRGQTLFHSFTDFSVPTNGQTNFLNPAGNRDIITRVTGSFFSDIDGLISTNGANFLLINPNGVIFGPNTQLNVGRSFVTTTANSVDFVDAAGKTYNFGVNRTGDVPLLAINSNVFFSPSKLIMGGNNSGSRGIINYGTLQTTNPGQYIGLIGGNITMNGGKIVAPGGRVDLGGLNSAGTVAIDRQGLVLSGNNLIRSDIALTNGAQISVRAKETLGTVDPFFNNASSLGSSINVSANNVRLNNNKFDAAAPQSGLDAGLAADSGVKTTTSGDIRIDSTGDVSLDNGSFIKNTILANATGKIGNIDIKAKSLQLNNRSQVKSTTAGVGNAGNITINAGNISLLDASEIQTGVDAGKGNGGDIKITTTGNISLVTKDPTLGQSFILASTNGEGLSGKITINTQGRGDILLSKGGIFAVINKDGNGDSNGIEIKAKNISLSNGSQVSASNFGQGNAGNIKIDTSGNLVMSGTDNPLLLTGNQSTSSLSTISAQTNKSGNSGKIILNVGGDLLIQNRSAILAGISKNGNGNSNGIEIKSKNLILNNFSQILARNNGVGNGGDIAIIADGNIIISGTDNPKFIPSKANINSGSTIDTSTNGKGDTGKITIDATGDLSLSTKAGISAGILAKGNGNSKGIEIAARNINIRNLSAIETVNQGGTGNAGKIDIEAKGTIDIQESNRKLGKELGIDPSGVSSKSTGDGKASDLAIRARQIDLNGGSISTNGNTVSGGDISLALRETLLLRNNSNISTNSNSNGAKSSGGNITINSPLIVATPSNNDITANANGGNGGKIDITSQGLFGIQNRPKGQESSLTNDITASSTFGQNGTVQISTPGIDPGKDVGELPTAPNDASDRISQACAASQRDNKLYITGRGGLPPNASDLLESESLWQDARGAQPKPVATAAQSAKLASPAIGWVFEQNGQVRLVAAQTAGSTVGIKAGCPIK